MNAAAWGMKLFDRRGKHCFFFYGTLMDPDVRRLVLGTEPAGAGIFPASLPGFAVRYVVGERYPALQAKPGAAAPGIVITALSPGQARALDRYEGNGYRRETRLVCLADRRRIAAMVYLPMTHLNAGRRPWSYQTWRRKDKAHFLWASGLNNPLRGFGADRQAR
ncbi:MAG: gamma-glutamylcyclotransferase [Proteobacteria bacterium]|nr:gamma-glutamylcyclotransferase [Pseudomonadota bacterium]